MNASKSSHTDTRSTSIYHRPAWAHVFILFALFFLAAACTSILTVDDDDILTRCLLMASPIMGVGAFLCWFDLSAIRLDERGIRLHYPLVTRFHPWNDIRALWYSKENHACIIKHGKGTTLLGATWLDKHFAADLFEYWSEYGPGMSTHTPVRPSIPRQMFALIMLETLPGPLIVGGMDALGWSKLVWTPLQLLGYGATVAAIAITLLSAFLWMVLLGFSQVRKKPPVIQPDISGSSHWLVDEALRKLVPDKEERTGKLDHTSVERMLKAEQRRQTLPAIFAMVTAIGMTTAYHYLNRAGYAPPVNPIVDERGIFTVLGGISSFCLCTGLFIAWCASSKEITLASLQSARQGYDSRIGGVIFGLVSALVGLIIGATNWGGGLIIHENGVRYRPGWVGMRDAGYDEIESVELRHVKVNLITGGKENRIFINFRNDHSYRIDESVTDFRAIGEFMEEHGNIPFRNLAHLER